MLNELVKMFDGEFALYIAISELWHGEQWRDVWQRMTIRWNVGGISNKIDQTN